MTQEFFRQQVSRLRTRFGERALDPEFVQLAWREAHDMSEPAFARFCDVMIGSRTHHKPPLLSEFREARMAEQKLRFDNEVRMAGQSWFGPDGPPAKRKEHVLKVLSREYGAVESVKDALEIARLRLRTGGAK